MWLTHCIIAKNRFSSISQLWLLMCTLAVLMIPHTWKYLAFDWSLIREKRSSDGKVHFFAWGRLIFWFGNNSKSLVEPLQNSDDKDYYWAFQHSHPLFVYLFFNPDIMTLRHRLEKSFALLLLWKKPSKSGDVFWSGHFQTETQVNFFLLTTLLLNRGLFSSEEMAELQKCFDTKGFQVGASADGSSQTSAN